MPNVELYFDSKKIIGWTALTIKQSINQLCGTWSGSFPNGTLDLNNINDQVLVAIVIDNEPEFVGYIEKYQTTVTEQEAVVELSGRSLVCDFVDSSVSDVLKSELGVVKATDYTPLDYIKYIMNRVLDDIYFSPYTKLNVIDLVDAEPLDVLAEELNIETATKGYNIVNNIAKKMGVTLTSAEDGSLILYRPMPVKPDSTPTNVKPLYATKGGDTNVLAGSLSYDTTDCYYAYKLVGDDGQMFEVFEKSTPKYTLILNPNAKEDIFQPDDPFGGGFRPRAEVLEFDTEEYTKPVIKTDRRFRQTRFTEIKFDGKLSDVNLSTYLDNEMSRRVAASLKYTCSVLGAGYRCRDYVRIKDELWDFNALFIVQTRDIIIKEDEITTNLTCVSANTYTAENAESVHNKAEIEIGMTAQTEKDIINSFDKLSQSVSGLSAADYEAQKWVGSETLLDKWEREAAEREEAKRAEQAKIEAMLREKKEFDVPYRFLKKDSNDIWWLPKLSGRR